MGLEPMKKCPYCAEEIQDAAIKCKHCGEFLNGSRPPMIPANRLPPPIGLPWYFGTTTIVVSLLTVGPLALPLVWIHPKLTVPWKVVISLVVLAFTWYSILLVGEWMKKFDEAVKMLQLQ